MIDSLEGVFAGVCVSRVASWPVVTLHVVATILRLSPCLSPYLCNNCSAVVHVTPKPKHLLASSILSSYPAPIHPLILPLHNNHLTSFPSPHHITTSGPRAKTKLASRLRSVYARTSTVSSSSARIALALPVTVLSIGTH